MSSILVEGGDDVGRAMADGGPDPFVRMHKLGDELDGVDPEAFASAAGRQLSEGDLSYEELERVIDNLETLDDSNVDGVNDSVRTMSRDPKNFDNYAYEADVAVAVQRSNFGMVTRMSRDVTSSDGPTELDIELEDGSTIEVKHGELEKAKKPTDQITTQLQYRSEQNLGGDHYVAAKNGVSGDMMTFLKKHNVEILDLSEVGL